MPSRFLLAALGAGFALLLSPAILLAQQPAGPLPLYPNAGPRSIEPEPLPPLAPSREPPASSIAPPASPPGAAAAAPSTPPAASEGQRVFCDQPVSVRVAERDAVPERYAPFIGIFSDASWTPQLCAALVVENVTGDGTAKITYVFGPMGSGGRGPRGILHGTGVVKDGELRFQNSDGSQFAFRPFYSDLDGHLVTPQGQSYQAVFKKTL